ncbi:hypothetical protein DH2020_017553 [Rehmannia glutinosa]|uniref:Uncharacterized protein n=1 Tax=Rehmannia glutinosa TaxID=99300 RepID=A0ABR0WR94_REHGL
MADDTRMKDLQEAQKRLDHILQTEAMKREATEQKLQEQMAGMSTEMQEQMLGLNGKYDHLTTTLATIQLQLLNLSKGKGVMEEESILGGPPGFSSEDINSRNQSTFRGRLQGDHQEEELSYQHTSQEEGLTAEVLEEEMEEIQMSLNVLSGEDGLTTMRLIGECGDHKLHILIDSGSTLSFIQEDTAKKLGCYLERAKPLMVKVANGQKMVSSYKAVRFKWSMQGHSFTYSPRVLKNEGCDMILGGDWLKSCTPIELDYEKMTFTVSLMGKRVKLQALTSNAECKYISGSVLYQMLHLDFPTQIEEVFVLTVDGQNYEDNPALQRLLGELKECWGKTRKSCNFCRNWEKRKVVKKERNQEDKCHNLERGFCEG